VRRTAAQLAAYDADMDVVVAGGHGKVGLRLLRLLAEGGHRARGLMRNPGHEAELRGLGAEPVLCDIEALDDISGCCERADAVVFAAGAGAGSGAERKRTVDYGGAVKLIEAAKTNGTDRYVIVSAISVDRPDEWSEQMRPYYEAKRDADERLLESGLSYTIVRPGGLTDDPGTGLVTVGTDLERGEVPREDVAAALVAVLETPSSVGKTFELVAGATPIEEAIRGL
jgi:uncharacterized protein YbjT (DUF2867 family)